MITFRLFLACGIALALLLLPSHSNAVTASAVGSTTPDAAPIDRLRGAGFFEQDFLKASNAGIEDNFGVSVAINEDGTLLVVGARYEDSDGSAPGDDSIPNAGAAYVFERTPAGWIERDWLKPSLPYDSPTDGAQFGLSVAISGDTIVVGEPYRNGENPAPGGSSWFNVGAVYVFEPAAGGWEETAVLQTPSDRPREDQFGRNVAILGDRIAIGAVVDDSDLTGPGSFGGTGAVYVYERDGNEWAYRAVVKPDNVARGETLFGLSISLHGRRMLVGAPFEDSDGSDPEDESAPNAGAAYLFERQGDGTTWTLLAYLKASNAESDDQFGHSVALYDDIAVVGAFGEDSDGSLQSDNSVDRAGAVYVFQPDAQDQWQQTAWLKSDAPSFLASFGYSLQLVGDVLAIGANREDALRGAAYLFQSDGSGGWTLDQRIQASNADPDDRFGHDLAYGGGRLAVSAWLEGSDPAGGPASNAMLQSGAVFVYGLPGFSIGVTVSGLNGGRLELRNNGIDSLVTGTDGPFAFNTPLADGSRYEVDVASQPTDPPQVCLVFDGSGDVDGTDVDSVRVECSEGLGSEGLLLPDAVTFGARVIGQSSLPEPMVFGNIGTSSLTVTAVGIGGPAGSEFEVVQDGCTATVLAASEECDLEVRFAPSMEGLAFAAIQVTSDVPGGPATAQLQGLGMVADALFVDSFE